MQPPPTNRRRRSSSSSNRTNLSLSPVKLLPRGLGLQQQAVVRLRALASVVDPGEGRLREGGSGRGLVVTRGVDDRDVAGWSGRW